MCARSSERRSVRNALRGFTLPELIGVLILVGVLSAVAFPKLDAALSIRGDAWRDEVVSALRYAHQTAVSHRRLVCASVGSNSVTLTIAAANPATTCGSSLNGPDGRSSYTTTASGNVTASVAPSGTLFFQPSGRVTSDGAGSAPSDRTITLLNTTPTLTIAVVGETGHVR